MKKLLLIFMLNSVFILAKQNLKFKIQEKNNENIKILIIKDNKTTKISIKNNKKIYVVKFGDTLSLIAKNVNLPIDYLVEINNIKNKNLIITNQKLILNK